jgi:hypothetical protein
MLSPPPTSLRHPVRCPRRFRLLFYCAVWGRALVAPDSIHDDWWPLGNGDMLDPDAIVAMRQQFFTAATIQRASDIGVISTGLVSGPMA